MFSHEKLTVYQHSIRWLAISAKLLRGFPAGNADHLANQLRRASLSIPLNIAEGAGKIGKLDKKRYYAIARGSALECAAILDAIIVLQLCDTENVSDGKKLLREIVAILSEVCIKKEV